MTNLQLVEVDPNPGGNGLPDLRTVKAVSTSYKSLEDYCKEEFGKPVNKREGSWDIYYEIEDANFVIVSGSHSKFK